MLQAIRNRQQVALVNFGYVFYLPVPIRLYLPVPIRPLSVYLLHQADGQRIMIKLLAGSLYRPDDGQDGADHRIDDQGYMKVQRLLGVHRNGGSLVILGHQIDDQGKDQAHP